ncbi:MAG TPA: TIGR03564 family F420-dependent LLM class oxidoreductase [Candidatus Limnocylindria bacterium]|nr:TIGR03564 family F420-dependent LLM class oxidoreductase [Candidatus Limnocylindria bacterium]
MRLGLLIGADRGRYRHKVAQLVGDAEAAEGAGFTSVWVPQVPGDFDAFTAITLMGRATRRIELGTAVVPIQTRHPIAMAQAALSNQAVCEGRFTLGIGTSHHWVIEGMLGLSYERPAQQMRHYLEVLNAALRGPGAVDVENAGYRVHSPIDVTDLVPNPVLLAALGPVMLRLAGEQASGTILWMADERAIGDYVVPRITRAAAEAGRPAPRIVAAIPATVCANNEVDDARAWTNQLFGQAGFSPNYQRLLARGDAANEGDLLAAGDESAVLARLRAFRDAGVTDLALRVIPLGADRASRLASRNRTMALLSSVCPEI